MDADAFHLAQRIVEDLRGLIYELQRPSVIYRVTIAQACIGEEGVDGYSCTLGGVYAEGLTPAEACENFDWYAWHGKPVPGAPRSGLAQRLSDGAESLAEVPGGLGEWVDLLREAAAAIR